MQLLQQIFEYSAVSRITLKRAIWSRPHTVFYKWVGTTITQSPRNKSPSTRACCWSIPKSSIGFDGCDGRAIIRRAQGDCKAHLLEKMSNLPATQVAANQLVLMLMQQCFVIFHNQNDDDVLRHTMNLDSWNHGGLMLPWSALRLDSA